MSDSEKEDGSSHPSDLEEIETRLRHARGQQPAPPSKEAREGAIGSAFRLSTELIAGVVVGGVIGWTLDLWLGTTPWLLLVFFFLGIAAGMLNVIRTAQQMNADAAKAKDAATEERSQETGEDGSD